MDQRLVIESDEAYALANELAEIAGKSVSEVVTAALKEKMEKDRQKAARTREIREIVREMQERWAKAGTPGIDAEDLYGEDGLPI